MKHIAEQFELNFIKERSEAIPTTWHENYKPEPVELDYATERAVREDAVDEKARLV